MSIEFTKMEGCGNDYVYVDARGMEADWPALSIAMSDRHFGIGSDGLILIMDSNKAALKMRMFNADGSEGEMCGNGIRCFTKFAIERDIAAPTNGGLTVETLGGVRTITPMGENGLVTRARVAMGAPTLRPEDVPVTIDPSKGRKHRRRRRRLPADHRRRGPQANLRLHGQPPRRGLHRHARGGFSPPRNRSQGRASPHVPQPGQLRNSQPQGCRKAKCAGVGARKRRDHGLRQRSMRHHRCRPHPRVSRRQR